MKLASTIARYLLGLIFTVFGLNGFLHFIPQVMPAGQLAVDYLTVLTKSHYTVPVFVIQLAGGLLLLANRYVPLALVLLGPVLVNILLYHGLMDPANIGPGIVATILWFLVFLRFQPAFRGIFAATPPFDATQR